MSSDVDRHKVIIVGASERQGGKDQLEGGRGRCDQGPLIPRPRNDVKLDGAIVANTVDIEYQNRAANGRGQGGEVEAHECMAHTAGADIADKEVCATPEVYSRAEADEGIVSHTDRAGDYGPCAKNRHCR